MPSGAPGLAMTFASVCTTCRLSRTGAHEAAGASFKQLVGRWQGQAASKKHALGHRCAIVCCCIWCFGIYALACNTFMQCIANVVWEFAQRELHGPTVVTPEFGFWLGLTAACHKSGLRVPPPPRATTTQRYTRSCIRVGCSDCVHDSHLYSNWQPWSCHRSGFRVASRPPETIYALFYIHVVWSIRSVHAVQHIFCLGSHGRVI